MILQALERRANLTKEAFKAEFLDPCKPVILTDMANDWPGLTKWTWDFFKETYGHFDVPLVDSNFHKAGAGYMESKTVKFRRYIEEIEKGPTDLRLFLFNIFALAPELRQDFTFPSIMEGFVKNLPFMFFGGEGSITPLHFDIDCPSNFLTHFQTTKRVLLFDRNQSKYLYHQPYTVHSQVDLHNPDYEKFPALKKAQGFEAILQHGETIYIPPHWWHYIEYSKSGFSLALRAHDRISNKVYAVKNLLQHSIIDKGMNKILGQRWKNWKIETAKHRAEV